MQEQVGFFREKEVLPGHNWLRYVNLCCTLHSCGCKIKSPFWGGNKRVEGHSAGADALHRPLMKCYEITVGGDVGIAPYSVENKLF